VCGEQGHKTQSEEDDGKEQKQTNLVLNSENAQKSLIGDFLVPDIPNIVTEQENALERLETALKRKPADKIAEN